MANLTETELKEIETYDIFSHSIEGLIELIEPTFREHGKISYINGTLKLSTGGWSGCEEIITALSNNIPFWSLYWFSSERGGHYIFFS